MTISERSNRLRFPCRICSLKVLVSSSTEGRKLVRKLLMPLFPQTRGDNDENLPLAFSPSLRQEDACLDCLAKSCFVSERSSQLLHAVRGTPLRQFNGEVFRVVGGARIRPLRWGLVLLLIGRSFLARFSVLIRPTNR